MLEDFLKRTEIALEAKLVGIRLAIEGMMAIELSMKSWASFMAKGTLCFFILVCAIIVIRYMMGKITSKIPHGEKLGDSIFQFYRSQGTAQLEVVFVSGLDHHNLGDVHWKTWLVRDTLDNFWPMTWLPDDFSSIEIFALKYDASIKQTTTVGRMDLFLVGEMLVQEIVGCGRIGQKGVPVVFVCHGFGGLVAKQIVTIAKRHFLQDTKAKKLLKNVGAFLFYSTPHHGSHLFKSSSYFYRFWGGRKGPLLENLEVLNTHVSRLNQDFEQDAKEHSWYFASAAEMHETKQFGEMVVKEGSSRYEGGHYFALSGDHFDVVRPKTKKDSSYLWLINCLKEVLDRNAVELVAKVESFVLDSFVRLEAQEEAIKKELQKVSIVGLVGMGGIGKTTLARIVYQSICKDFESSCYLDSVKSKAGPDEVMITLLQNFGIRDKKTGCIVDRSALQDCKKSLLDDLKTYVHQHKVLVVIDDVKTKKDFASMLDGMDFLNGNKESKVIVTCRNWQVLKDYVPRCSRYEVKPMSSGQDTELFSYHAFMGSRSLEERHQILLEFLSKDSSEQLINDFESLCNDIVKACGGLPLSLEVMGCHLGSYLKDGDLSSNLCLDYWRGALEKLERAEPLEGGDDFDGLWNVLQISYDCLFENEKNIFLDIACFFCDSMRYSEQTLSRIWGGKFSNLNELKNLKERCLIKINTEDDSVIMHDHLRDMGRGIVRRQCERDLNKMTRLWDFEDVSKVLRSNEIKAPLLQGLSLEKWYITSVTIMEDKSIGLSEQQKIGELDGFNLDCPSMRLLNLYKVEENMIEAISFKGFSYIQWLCLKGTNISKLPEFMHNCHKLCVLDMRDCKYLKNLDESFKNLVNLLELNLSECTNLVSLPHSLGDMVNLTRLILSGCKGLINLPNSIGNLVKLLKLDISSCERLISLPNVIGKFINLFELDISGCEGLTSLPNVIGNLVKLLKLNISSCKGITSLPNSIGKFVNLSELDISGCEGLTTLPDSICELVKLSKLNISGCKGITSLPIFIGKLVKLLKLDLSSCKGLTSLPDSIGELTKLLKLNISSCEKLISLPNAIGNLVNLYELDISDCKGLTSLPNSIDNLVNLCELDISSCTGLTSLPDSIGKLVKLSKLDISGCKKITSLPNSIGNLVKLSKLDISGCKKITSLPNSIGNLVKLSKLDISGCKKITSLPNSIGNLVKLSELDISGCKRIITLPNSTSNLVKLLKLNISDCEGLTSLPDSIGKLVNLSELDISGCEGLTSLPDSIGNLVKLLRFSICGCWRLTSLPNSIGKLVKLLKLDISGCEELTNLPNSIGMLVNLSILDLAGCEGLICLPDSIGMLVNLSIFNIYGCKGLTSLPDSIGKLVNLSTLNIFGCKRLTSLPDSIGDLGNLSIFNIFGCEGLTSLPDSIGKLVNLSTLDISGCKGLLNLPTMLGHITFTTSLHKSLSRVGGYS